MRLILLGTSGCHLCEEAETIIQACLLNIAIEKIDIAEQEHWQADYAIRIPVLLDLDSQKELAWRFDKDDVTAFVGANKLAPTQY
ncbi:hypothetical protein BAC3_01442 [uncultured bacterium]|nr:hypothetical protein BAC3_01442 [uncultured bacterium]